MFLNESIVGDAALTWFGELGYAVGHGLKKDPCEPAAQRDFVWWVVIAGHLREMHRRLSPAISQSRTTLDTQLPKLLIGEVSNVETKTL